MEKRSASKDYVIIGFALFAMFFGAGNLIFPPYLGKMAGSKVFPAMLGFLISGVGLPLAGIIACAKINGTFTDIAGRVGKKFAIFANTAIIICIGPMLAVPRTAATTHELAIQPNLPNVSPVITVVIFFVIALSFVLRPSRIVDYIGKFLTPALLILLCIIIVKGIISPLGPIIHTNIEGAFSKSLLEGYQTMDGMGSAVMATIVIMDVRSRGYKSNKAVVKVASKAAIIAALGLGLVYGGLMFLGSQTAAILPKDMPRTALVIEIVRRDLGNIGPIILGIAVGLACLTTAIALITTAANYFSDLSEGKVSYNAVAIIVTVISAVFGTFGVEKIIQIAVPILQILYPISIILVVITLAGKVVKSNKVVRVTIYATLIVSILDTINSISSGSIEFIKSIIEFMPLASSGFSWLVPSVIVFLISSIIYRKDVTELEVENI
ncbi:branched-chain amino acid transport system II carrier protein [Clostridium oceanicum]|uniref:Branched-chain amino acid transport system carrier protein n=1 Tax=Clostridium oceanicum TaxID=1543 RepID=A0ABN1JGH2_9CLOT